MKKCLYAFLMVAMPLRMLLGISSSHALSVNIRPLDDLSAKASLSAGLLDEPIILNGWSNGYLARPRKPTERKAALEMTKRKRKSRVRIFEIFIRSIAYSSLVLTEFDEKLWSAAIDRVTLDDRPVFQSKDGTEVEGYNLHFHGCKDLECQFITFNEAHNMLRKGRISK